MIILPGTAGLTKLYLEKVIPYWNIETISSDTKACQKIIDKYKDQLFAYRKDAIMFPTGYKAKAPTSISRGLVGMYINDKIILVVQLKPLQNTLFSVVFTEED